MLNVAFCFKFLHRECVLFVVQNSVSTLCTLGFLFRCCYYYFQLSVLQSLNNKVNKMDSTIFFLSFAMYYNFIHFLLYFNKQTTSLLNCNSYNLFFCQFLNVKFFQQHKTCKNVLHTYKKTLLNDFKKKIFKENTRELYPSFCKYLFLYFFKCI